MGESKIERITEEEGSSSKGWEEEVSVTGGALILFFCSHVRDSPEIVTTHSHSADLVFAPPSSTRE